MFDFFSKRKEKKFQEHKKAAEDAYCNNQDIAHAVQELELALKARSNCYETWCQYGDWCDALASEHMMKEEMNEFAALREKAEQAIRKSIEINPQYALGHYRLANILWGSDFRKALVEFEKAAELDAQYEKDVERTKNIIAECTHKLSELKVIHLNSLREKPLPQVYDTEFYFEDTPIGCVVMYAVYSGTERQWTNSWVFRSEKPDFFKESPIGEVQISSTNHSSVNPGCPGDYWGFSVHLYKEDLLKLASFTPSTPIGKEVSSPSQTQSKEVIDDSGVFEDMSVERNPFMETTSFDKPIIPDGTTILRNKKGKKVGRMEKALFSDDLIVRDKKGKKAGRITQSSWDSDKQIIKDKDGSRVGKMKTDFLGRRIIVDKEGKKVGQFDKTIWGKTIIRKKKK